MIKMRIFIFILNFLATLSNASEAIVQLEKGTLHGVREIIDGVSVDKYFGVPYAKPPINDLRFKRTVEEESWDGVLEAQHIRPLCAQAKGSMNRKISLFWTNHPVRSTDPSLGYELFWV